VKSRNPFLANIEWRGILQYSRVKTVQMGASAKWPWANFLTEGHFNRPATLPPYPL